VDEQSNIIAGHGRILAAQRLGLAEVPAVVARGWDEARRRAYLLADNQLPLNASWNLGLLRIELGELRGLGADLGLTGFGELELERLLGPERDEDVDSAPNPSSDPVSKRGDVWACGEHRVLCGDAVEPADYQRLLPGEVAEMTFTDPPYNVDYSNTSEN